MDDFTTKYYAVVPVWTFWHLTKSTVAILNCLIYLAECCHMFTIPCPFFNIWLLKMQFYIDNLLLFTSVCLQITIYNNHNGYGLRCYISKPLKGQFHLRSGAKLSLRISYEVVQSFHSKLCVYSLKGNLVLGSYASLCFCTHPNVHMSCRKHKKC